MWRRWSDLSAGSRSVGSTTASSECWHWRASLSICICDCPRKWPGRGHSLEVPLRFAKLLGDCRMACGGWVPFPPRNSRAEPARASRWKRSRACWSARAVQEETSGRPDDPGSVSSALDDAHAAVTSLFEDTLARDGFADHGALLVEGVRFHICRWGQVLLEIPD